MPPESTQSKNLIHPNIHVLYLGTCIMIHVKASFTTLMRDTVSGFFVNPIPCCHGPKGLSCFKKKIAKHFLKFKKLKIFGIPVKLYSM